MNSRQHSQVAEIGRTPMTSRELLPFLTSEDLAQSEETSAVCLPSHLKMFKVGHILLLFMVEESTVVWK